MKVRLAVVLVLLVSITVAHADVYEWVDDKGVVHFTDDPDRIPDKYLKKVKQRPTEKSPTPSAGGEQKASPAEGKKELKAQPVAPPPALYGDHDEAWWRSRFTSLRKELKGIQDGLPKMKEELVKLRRKRVLYQGAQERVAYNDMNAQIEKDEARVVELEMQLASLEQDADRAGVPVEWRK